MTAADARRRAAGPAPYYSRDGIEIFCGDARDILPQLELSADVVIIDPVWPNAVPTLAGADDPLGLFTEIAAHFPRLTSRVVVHLGCDSDPRFLTAVPVSLPFFRACWLEYVRPHYKGRLMYTNDVAYVFGQPPPVEVGARVMPGRMVQTDHRKRPAGHPCGRQLQHVKWLVRWYARGLVLDPMAGTGTTLLAAQQAGLPAVGIEISEAFCALAVDRLRQGVLPFGEGVASD